MTKPRLEGKYVHIRLEDIAHELKSELLDRLAWWRTNITAGRKLRLIPQDGDGFIVEGDWPGGANSPCVLSAWKYRALARQYARRMFPEPWELDLTFDDDHGVHVQAKREVLDEEVPQ